MIYYGDEAGMWGGNDPDDRMPMMWPDLKFAPQAIDPRGGTRKADEVGFDVDLFAFYKAAAALRKKHDALRRGEFRIAGTFDAEQTFAFERRLGDASLIVVLNRSEQTRTVQVKVEGKFANPRVIFTSSNEQAATKPVFAAGVLTVTLPALSGAVIAP